MQVILVGPGRAGLALCLRLTESGHTVVGVLGRTREPTAVATALLETKALIWDDDLPSADLVVVAVRDDAIAAVAGRLGGRATAVDAAVHLSGLRPVSDLAPFGGLRLGSFHPLQTMPTPEIGARRLEGAWVGVTSSDGHLVDRLFGLATSAGMHPFALADESKAVYHAAAAAAANYVVTSLAMAERLLDAADVPFEAVLPLVRAVVDNAAEMGPEAALTGPIARGDVGTVRAQVEAIGAIDADLARSFKDFGLATADLAGTSELFEEILR